MVTVTPTNSSTMKMRNRMRARVEKPWMAVLPCGCVCGVYQAATLQWLLRHRYGSHWNIWMGLFDLIHGPTPHHLRRA